MKEFLKNPRKRHDNRKLSYFVVNDFFQDARKQLEGAFIILIVSCGLLTVMGIYALDLFNGANNMSRLYIKYKRG